jgi:hypothetical protein
VPTASELAEGLRGAGGGAWGARLTNPRAHLATLRSVADALASPPPRAAADDAAACDESAASSAGGGDEPGPRSGTASLASSRPLADRVGRTFDRSGAAWHRRGAGAWRGVYSGLPADAPAHLVGESLDTLVADALAAVAAPREYLKR